MNLPKDVRVRFQRHGRRGGRLRAKRLSPAARKAIARDAVVRRWIRARFGDRYFENLGLPGGEMVDKGLRDLAYEEETAESLMVALAAPRLRREGVPLPKTMPILDPDWRLYRLLERRDGELAHARYLAHLRQVASFADACETARRRARQSAR